MAVLLDWAEDAETIVRAEANIMGQPYAVGPLRNIPAAGPTTQGQQVYMNSSPYPTLPPPPTPRHRVVQLQDDKQFADLNTRDYAVEH